MYLFNSSGPLTTRKLMLSSFAVAWAKRVFPQPGGPYKRIPYDNFIGIFSNKKQYFKGI